MTPNIKKASAARHYRFFISGLNGAFACLLAVSLWACSDGKKDQSSPPAPDLSKFSGLYSSYLSSCKECHEPNNIYYKENVTNLDMSSEEAAFNSLLKVVENKKRAGVDCGTPKYVVSGDPSRSYLYAMMDGPTADSFPDNACRPVRHTKSLGGEANEPTAEQKQKLKEWIEKGAPRN